MREGELLVIDNREYRVCAHICENWAYVWDERRDVARVVIRDAPGEPWRLRNPADGDKEGGGR